MKILAGGCSYDKHGTPITDEVFYKALESEVVMLVLLVVQSGIMLNFQKNLKEHY